MMFDNSNRPDAGLYHLPYTNIINDSKIIFGITNIHFRFGHISILQYLSAPYYYGPQMSGGITVPIAIIYSVFISFFFEIFFSRNKNDYHNFLSFFLLFAALYGMNRYSGMGNDVPAHLFYFLVIYFFLTNLNSSSYQNNFNKQMIYSSFCFLCKPTLLFVFLLPAYDFFKNFRNLRFFKIFLICFIMLFSWLFKNYITSSCLLYPSAITCFETPWSSATSIQSNPSLVENMAEAWSKDFPNKINKNLNYENYLENFKWVSTWFQFHFKIILENILIYIIFFIFIIFRVINFEINKNDKDNKLRIFFFFIASSVSLIFWFNKFPIYRYGESIIISFILSIILLIILYQDKNKYNFKFLRFILSIIIIVVISKNTVRIIHQEYKEYNNYPWPKLYSYNKKNNQIEYKKIFIEGNTFYYKPYNYDNCMYGKSPCTNLDPGNIKSNKYLFNYKSYEIVK